MDWNAWHKLYKSNSGLQKRLELVRDQVKTALNFAPPGEIRLISLCAGDGRDVLLALDGHKRASDVRARLVEFNPELVATGKTAIQEAGLADRVELVQGDATQSSAYAGIAPAQVVVMAGMLGLVPFSEIPSLVQGLGSLAARDARLIWTRNLKFRDGIRHSMAFRSALAKGSFEAELFKMTSWANPFRRNREMRFVVATYRHLADPTPLQADKAFFQVIDGDDIRIPA